MPVRYQLFLRLKAVDDLEAIDTFIRSASPQGADRIIQAVLTAIEALRVYPHRYPIRDRRVDPSLSVRSMPVEEYMVYYQVDDGGPVVRILTVRHGARRQPKRFR